MTETMTNVIDAPARSLAAPKPAPGVPREYHFPHFERHALPNGLRVIVAPVTKLPIVTVMAIVDAGAECEPDRKQGVASLTGRLLLEGAAGLDGAALADRFERIGASIDAHADWDVAAVTLTSLSARLPEALGLMRDLIRSPMFPEREVQRLKDERLSDLLQLRAEPRGLADEQFSRAVYEPSARYASPEAGDEASVSALMRGDVVSFHAERFQPSAVTLVFAGDVTSDQALSLAESLFGDWAGTTPAPAPGGIDAASAGTLLRVVAKVDAPQSELRVGHVGLSRSAADFFDTTVMNAVLGGLFSSRINLNLREAHGYTYGASSAFEWRRGVGPFMVHTAVKSDVTGAAIKEILGEIARMRAEEISSDELTLATSYLDGVFPIRYETTSAIASALANLVVYGLPDDYYDAYRLHVRAVTTAGVLEAARAHLHPDRLRVVVVGDPATVVEQSEAATAMKAEVVTLDVPEGGV